MIRGPGLQPCIAGASCYSRPVVRLVLILALAALCWGCAGNPFETNNITKDGTIYRDTESMEAGEARSTINVRGATF